MQQWLHGQKTALEIYLNKTEDYFKHKIRNRPEHSELLDMHIVQDSTAEESIQASQMKLKRARLADNLNEKIALRPGPLELVEKNIIPVDSAVKEAIKDLALQRLQGLEGIFFSSTVFQPFGGFVIKPMTGYCTGTLSRTPPVC
uniref:Phosphatase and actin regulator n=1 Tax=Naja naja TaxID=35670 RepID=A0A8C6X8B6_NAJNA